MKITMRFMTQGDVDEVMILERATFSTPWEEKIFSTLLKRGDSLYLTARSAGILVGYAGATLIGPEVHVTNMAVDEGLRRKGIASSLLLECLRIARARGIRWATLEVRENNEAGREFYKKFGFKDLGMRLGYYEDTGEHAVIMATGDIATVDYSVMLQEIRSGLTVEKEGVP